MTGRWLLVILGCAACGDDAHHDDIFTAVSGSRIALQLYRYDDGTQQPGSNELYDKELHTLCTPQRFFDGVVRCVPVADDAVYVDPTCTRLVGRAQTIASPTHFIVYESNVAETLPARIFEAADPTDPVALYYEKRGSACLGPFGGPGDIPYFKLGAEIDGTSLVPVRDDELGDGKVALQLHETDDGLRVPFELRDRDLGVACTPTLQGDGSVRCEPAEASPASYFHDPACREPVVVVSDELAKPRFAKVVESDGCARYHRVGDATTPPLYRLDGETCSPTGLPLGRRAFSVRDAIELPLLERTVEAVASRRLQHIVLGDGALHFMDQRLFDTATRADCERHAFSDVTRCLPADLAAATTLFTSGCVTAVAVAEVPQRTCQRPRFATGTTAEGIEIRAIGDRVSGPVFQRDLESCAPYVAPPATDLLRLGPPIDPQAFVAAVYFGAR